MMVLNTRFRSSFFSLRFAIATILCLLFPLLCFASTFAKIKKSGVLKVCSESGYLPLEMKTAKGKWLGFDPAMMEAYSKSIGVQLEMLDTKWDGIIPSLLTGKCDMIASSMAKTKEREKVVQFSDPYYDNKLLVAVANTEENKKKFKTLGDLNQSEYKIAVKTGASPDIYLQNSQIFNKAQILRFDADADTVTAVLQKRSTAFVYDTPYVKLAAMTYPDQLYILPETLEGDQFAVAMRKSDTELLKSFNAFLHGWKKNGGYEKTMKYYFEGQEWKALLNK